MGISLFDLILNIADPFHIGRNYILKPIKTLLINYYDETVKKTANGVVSARDIILRLILMLLAFVVLLWTSSFLYVAFYYTYMPTVGHTRPAHMQFLPCESGSGNSICSFPQAHVTLTTKQQLLMVGQPYRVLVKIEMPESPTNRNLGMFMVCAEMRDQDTTLRAHSCRSAMLHYKSILRRWFSSLIKLPFYLLNLHEEKQEIEVELFTTFHDDDRFPVTDVTIEIQSTQIEFYTVSLHITAHFTGLRYVMYNWPLLSAVVGILTNLFFIVIISLLSWYHWSDSNLIEETKERLSEAIKNIPKKTRTDTDSSESIEEIRLLDDEDIEDIPQARKSSTEVRERFPLKPRKP